LQILIRLVLIQPVGDVSETKSMYKEVVLGGDVWDLLDELMIYMGNPMQYYEKGVKFVRVTFLSIIKDANISIGPVF
jgi:cell division protease FtsH